MSLKKGIAPVLIVILVAVGLIGGAAAGYEFREPIKKAIQGKSTSEEINSAVEDAKDEIAKGKDKFELEGVTTDVDSSGKKITVKIKSSTDSIKEMRLSDTPITLTDVTKIKSGSEDTLKIADIPINAQVHVGGTISDGVLTATKVEIQKDDVGENGNVEKTDFIVGGTVKSTGASSIIVTVATANKLAKDQKGKDLTIKVDSLTIIEKGHSSINLADLKAGDTVQIKGVIDATNYIAAQIKVKVQEEAGELEATETESSSNGNGAANNEDKSNDSSNNSNSSGNSDNSNKNKSPEPVTE